MNDNNKILTLEEIAARKHYSTLVVDPPWKKERGGGGLGANYQYSLMTLDEIAALPIHDLADQERGCHLYLWVTNATLADGLDLIKKWGFYYITTITWVKDGAGLGQYFRGGSEHCLFARTKKILPYKVINGHRQQGITAFYEPKREHSRKPEKMREMIEQVSYRPRLEIFARESFPGWDSWGLEASNTIDWDEIPEDLEHPDIPRVNANLANIPKMPPSTSKEE